MFWWQEEGKLEIFVKSNRYLIPKQEFIKFLEKETAKCVLRGSGYTVINPTYLGFNTIFGTVKYCDKKAMYHDVLHFMLCNMKDTVKVQMYDDGAVRLYQYDEEMKLSIWWDTPECYTHPLNLLLINKLVEFVKQYK